MSGKFNQNLRESRKKLLLETECSFRSLEASGGYIVVNKKFKKSMFTHGKSMRRKIRELISKKLIIIDNNVKEIIVFKENLHHVLWSRV